jgi:hypothetical protein
MGCLPGGVSIRAIVPPTAENHNFLREGPNDMLRKEEAFDATRFFAS